MTNKNSLFTQKHYEHMMQMLSYIYDDNARITTAQFLCAVFENDNPKFKRDLFLQGARPPTPPTHNGKETTNV